MLQLYSFDSGYSLVVLGDGGGGIRRIRYYNFFPKHSFLFFYYHKMNFLYSFIISKILVYIFNFFFHKPLKFNRKRLSHKLSYISGHFWKHISMNIFSGKRYFNDILWAPAYSNNTLPDTVKTAIRYKNTRNTAMQR